jgi:hypothetical protein
MFTDSLRLNTGREKSGREKPKASWRTKSTSLPANKVGSSAFCNQESLWLDIRFDIPIPWPTEDCLLSRLPERKREIDSFS